MKNENQTITITIRLTQAEKAEIDACAKYLGLPISTFYRFAAKQVFNEHRKSMVDLGVWNEELDKKNGLKSSNSKKKKQNEQK